MGSTEVTVNIPYDDKLKILLGKALMWPLWNEKINLKSIEQWW